MRVGFLGVGHLAEALIEGFLRAGCAGEAMMLSPRGHGAKLSRSRGLALAVDNAALVADSDVIFLATRPSDALTAVAGLPWRANQILVSACAGVAIAALERAAAPARIVRIMPLTAAAIGASPTSVFPNPEGQPDLEILRALLGRLGPVIPLGSEAQFETATVSAAIYGWAQSLIGLGCDWSTAHGMAPDSARLLAAATFIAAGRMIAERPEPVETLVAQLTTPGGITERGLQVLDSHGAPQAWQEACEAVHAMLTTRNAQTGG